MDRMTAAQARRTMLAAQGLAGPRPAAPTMRHLQREVDRLGQLQIDSVNVVVRAHYAPLFARLGPYDPALLDRAAGQAPRRVFEHWGHAASLIDVALHPALAWRMSLQSRKPWHWVERVDRTAPGLLDRVREEVAASGWPLTAREVEARLETGEARRHDHWGWNWSAVKTALEWLWTTGELLPAHRTSQFERAYAPAARVLPPSVRDAASLEVSDAHVVLVERAARSLGVATTTCLADYFRTSAAATRAAVSRLVSEGRLVPVKVDGWGPAFRHVDAPRPRRVDARALLCPFDPLVFERTRVERLFGVRYRIGIYTPAAQREHGYYVYLFALGEELAARVDLKADRRAGVLRVQTCFRTESVTRADADVARALAAELATMAGWLGLADVAVADQAPGDLVDALRRALA